MATDKETTKDDDTNFVNKTRKDMETVTDFFEEQQFDLSRLDRAITKLVEVNRQEREQAAAFKKANPAKLVQISKDDLDLFVRFPNNFIRCIIRDLTKVLQKRTLSKLMGITKRH